MNRNTFRCWQAQIPRDQRFRFVDKNIILIKPRFVSNIENIAKSFGRDQRRHRAFAFNNRVGRQGRAVDQNANIRWLQSG